MRRYTVTVDGSPFTMDIEETAADRFTVTVGGRTFEASLEAAEDLPGTVIQPGMPLPAAPALPGATGPRPSPVPKPGVAGAAGAGQAVPSISGGSTGGPDPDGGPGNGGPGTSRGSVVAAPMPGVVLDVHVVIGAVVRRGDPLLVLEAMKMRNTIRAPRAGVVAEVTAEAGRPVVAGEPLIRLGDAPR